jgi:hypothetical protein
MRARTERYDRLIAEDLRNLGISYDLFRAPRRRTTTASSGTCCGRCTLDTLGAAADR